MDTTEEELLTKIHKVTLYILLAFDKVCRENDLTYFLDSGSALGAVRHGGFIPWDDDIDVGMPRKDYERFLQIGQEKLPKDFFIQTRDTDPTYRRNAAKLRLKGTIFQEFDILPYSENGFYIDIFPYDIVPRNKFVARIFVRTLCFLNRVNDTWGSFRKSGTWTLRAFQKIIKLMPNAPMMWLDKKCIRLCRKFENHNSRYISPFYWGMSYQKSYIFETEKMFPVKDILFEGHEVKIVNAPDYYLSLTYGNYMQLPPEEKREPKHLKGIINFGKYV